MSQRAVGHLWFKMKCISLLLLFVEQIQGSSEIIQKFLPTGKRSSISFPADDLSKHFVVSLFYNTNITIGTCYFDGDPKLMKDFTGKVELSCPASLIFPSPQKSDCGLYSVRVTGDQSKIGKGFNVTFQDPVSPVGLKVISESSCKATCSTDDDEINGIFRCDDKSCHLVGGQGSKITKSGAILSLYQSNGSIICNHSNQVNWTQNKKEIQPCLRSEGSTEQTALIAGVIVAIGLVVAAIIGGVCYCEKRNLACFAPREPSNSQVPQPQQVNGDPCIIPESDHLMKENIEVSPV
ncbi:uncharacterized protein LOC116722001 [Xiphophorus hellerii]|uniref:uncharacterized protein LOC116722001 n=1 Tax=Xiphophorus hellerii TaxID=8084 RepID=UPI0013B36D15|nr:uncharacterized protein LOC116722001 [Xiphophorus hellerii]